MVPEDTLRRIAQLEDSCTLLFQQAEWAAVHIVRLENILAEHQQRLGVLSAEISQLRRLVVRLARAVHRTQVFLERISDRIGQEEERTRVAEVQFDDLTRDLERLRLQFLQGLHQLD